MAEQIHRLPWIAKKKKTKYWPKYNTLVIIIRQRNLAYQEPIYQRQISLEMYLSLQNFRPKKKIHLQRFFAVHLHFWIFHVVCGEEIRRYNNTYISAVCKQHFERRKWTCWMIFEHETPVCNHQQVVAVKGKVDEMYRNLLRWRMSSRMRPTWENCGQ
jgi:hypothetical protein